MPTRRAIDVEMYTLAAAYLRSENKLQAEIAGILKISQPEVSRMLKRAASKHWLDYPPPCFRCPDNMRDSWERAHARFFSSEKLLARLRAFEPPGVTRLKKISIFHGDAEGNFNHTVIPAVEEILAETAVMGVTWGRTVHGLVEALQKHPLRPLRQSNPIRFVPLCGEPLKDLDARIERSSSALAVSLHELVNGARAGGGNPPSLRGIPAFIPSGFNAAEVRAIRRFMRQFVGYGAVFGEHHAATRTTTLAEQVDTVLTSVGVIKAKYRGIFLRERVQLREITDAELNDAAIGDIGGLIVAQRKASATQLRRIAAMNERWTGIKLDDLERYAEAAARGKYPGVVVLATDRNRKDMVVRCIELGFINQLIITRDLADELGAA